MNDLIDRQAAIDALRAMQTYKMFAGDDLLLIDQAGAQTELMMLPSTQSKTNCSEFPNNSDAISRQAAIDSMCELMRHWFGCDSKDEIREIKRELGKLPSAQPEPCEDVVSRQRLLSDLKELTAAWGKYPVMEEQIKGVEAATGYVETIPSAQPEIIRCRDCKWKNRHNCTRAVEVPINDDKYCAWAERRTDETD